MTKEPWPARVASLLPQHGVSMPEYYLLCTAGYRINLDRHEFLEQAAAEFRGSSWPVFTTAELTAALRRLIADGLLTIWTEQDVHQERERRAASTLPELDDGVYYQPGHVNFTEPGFMLYRRLIHAIHGDDFLRRHDAGFKLDPAAQRFDVYAHSAETCQTLMDGIQGDGDAYTGGVGTVFIGTDGPVAIGAWRPNRFVTHRSGYHGVVRYRQTDR